MTFNAIALLVGQVLLLFLAFGAIVLAECVVIAAIQDTVNFIRRLNGLTRTLERIEGSLGANRYSTIPTPTHCVPSVSLGFEQPTWGAFDGALPITKPSRKRTPSRKTSRRRKIK